MACYQEVTCPACGNNTIMKSGRSARDIQHYRCQQQGCSTKTFMQEYRYKAYEPGIKEKIVDMAINNSGIRDAARVLKINKNTVIRTLKKQICIVQVNSLFHTLDTKTPLDVRLELVCESAELDEQWSFVGNKERARNNLNILACLFAPD